MFFYFVDIVIIFLLPQKRVALAERVAGARSALT